MEKVFPIIETERLLLRQLVPNDAKDLFETFSSEEAMIHYGMYPYKDLEQAENLVTSFNESFKTDKAIRWGIELKSEQKIIGTCGFHNWHKRNKRSEVGYEINPKYWRRGYMIEALVEVLNYGFTELELNRIEAVVYPENLPSQESLLRLGFEKEGLLKEYMIFRDKPQDLLIYSLFAEDFDY